MLVLGLLPELRARLLALLAGLSQIDWQRPTCCPGWSVHDVALHLLGGDLGILSRGRDGYPPLQPRSDEPFVPFLNRINDEWVVAARRLSPRVLIDLLRLGGEQTEAYFASLDPFALGERVSWAGSDAAPNWLGIAREYTERWVHQQQIREAVGAPLLDEARWLGPVLATFSRALPVTFAGVEAPTGTAVSLVVDGEAGGNWTVVRSSDGAWVLHDGRPERPSALARLPADTAWRLFTKQLAPDQAASRAMMEGDAELGRRLLTTVAIIA